nr:hypothetical protein [Streptomyces sp. NK08204]
MVEGDGGGQPQAGACGEPVAEFHHSDGGEAEVAEGTVGPEAPRSGRAEHDRRLLGDQPFEPGAPGALVQRGQLVVERGRDGVVGTALRGDLGEQFAQQRRDRDAGGRSRHTEAEQGRRVFGEEGVQGGQSAAHPARIGGLFPRPGEEGPAVAAGQGFGEGGGDDRVRIVRRPGPARSPGVALRRDGIGGIGDHQERPRLVMSGRGVGQEGRRSQVAVRVDHGGHRSGHVGERGPQRPLVAGRPPYVRPGDVRIERALVPHQQQVLDPVDRGQLPDHRRPPDAARAGHHGRALRAGPGPPRSIGHRHPHQPRRVRHTGPQREPRLVRRERRRQLVRHRLAPRLQIGDDQPVGVPRLK